ncbi:DUF3068 domain-containing protein [Actinophytocola sp.]|jgi:hypothetical protein|uniref:DUF3068 domain-containing protein n=1 Tax=Actinophytocola sp. TaxID=1872138 RepID=UPI002EDAB003
MRRIVSYVLIGMGVFGVVLGLLLRFYAYPRLVKLPLDMDVVSVAHGSGVTSVVIDSVNGVPMPEIRHDLSVTSTTHITGDLTQPEVVEGGDISVWIQATRTVDDGSGILINASVRSLCIDRHTGEAVAPCEGQYIEEQQGKRVTADRHTVQQPGLSFSFPFGTEQHSYQLYDALLKRTVEARFDGTDNIKGVDVYRFVAETKPTKLGEQVVPGSMVGMEADSVPVDQFYQDRRTMWVEPATGAVIAAEDKGKQELLAPGQSPGEGTTVYEGTMILNEKSVDDNVRAAKDSTGKLGLLTSGPIVLWIVGGVLIVVGVPLLVRSPSGNRRRRRS